MTMAMALVLGMALALAMVTMFGRTMEDSRATKLFFPLSKIASEPQASFAYISQLHRCPFHQPKLICETSIFAPGYSYPSFPDK